MRASRWKQKDGVINWTADPRLAYRELGGDEDGEDDTNAVVEDEVDAVVAVEVLVEGGVAVAVAEEELVAGGKAGAVVDAGRREDSEIRRHPLGGR